jgi:hypothetical protein
MPPGALMTPADVDGLVEVWIRPAWRLVADDAEFLRWVSTTSSATPARRAERFFKDTARPHGLVEQLLASPVRRIPTCRLTSTWGASSASPAWKKPTARLQGASGKPALRSHGAMLTFSGEIQPSGSGRLMARTSAAVPDHGVGHGAVVSGGSSAVCHDHPTTIATSRGLTGWCHSRAPQAGEAGGRDGAGQGRRPPGRPDDDR